MQILHEIFSIHLSNEAIIILAIYVALHGRSLGFPPEERLQRVLQAGLGVHPEHLPDPRTTGDL